MPFQCLLCSQPALQSVEEFSTLPRVTSDAKAFPAGGTLSVCANCGAVQKLPDETFLAEIQSIYSSYDLYELAEGREQVIFVDGSPRLRSEILVDLVQQRLDSSKPNRIIDIGCGNGAALRTLSRRLPTAKLWGSELSGRNEPLLNRIPNFQALFTTASKGIPLRFDVVTIIHVLEHVLEPVQFLRDCANLLQSSGLMLVEVPDVETSPFDLIIADHLMHFSMRTLGFALSQAGLRISLLSNGVLKKEVTAFAACGPASGTEDVGPGDSLRRARDAVDWLRLVLAQARGTPTNWPTGIFGTSMAGIWLYGAMKDRVTFFVDEDEAKVGNEIDGLPIFHPANVPGNARVLVPLPVPIANNIAGRWSSPGREYVTLGSDVAKVS